MFDVAVVKYEKPYDSLKEAIDLCGGLESLSPTARVFLKPNYVIWHEGVNFPKYGVLTTTRMIEDMVRLLKDRGINDITIAEGMVEMEKSKESMLGKAAKGLGLDVLKDRYGIKILDMMKRPFTKITVGDLKMSVNQDILEADYVIDMPVLKTHAQAVVSLGVKNLKGTLNIASRKKCHNPDPNIGLQWHVAKLPSFVPINLTVIDGIYTVDRGPMYTGFAHRSNIIIASNDVISADKVGAKILGIGPENVPHLTIAAKDHNRPIDLGDINIKGNVDIDSALKPHKWAWEHGKKANIPDGFEKAGIKGLTYPPADDTVCTYCSSLIETLIMGIVTAGNKDKTFDDVEVLYGKRMLPSPGHKHTLLFGQCQVKLNGKSPLINHCVTIPGCPAKQSDIPKALHEAGIEAMDNLLEFMDKAPEIFHMKKYKDRPEFDPSFYTVT